MEPFTNLIGLFFCNGALLGFSIARHEDRKTEVKNAKEEIARRLRHIEYMCVCGVATVVVMNLVEILLRWMYKKRRLFTFFFRLNKYISSPSSILWSYDSSFF